MSKLIYYSLTFDKNNVREDIVLQLIASVRSIRDHNTTIPIVVFVYDYCPAEIFQQLQSYNVHIEFEESYFQRLSQILPRAAKTLSKYPVLHRWLNFSKISHYNPDQVLYIDCDTLFFDDVDRLFETYKDKDCYAREEPNCSRNHYGYDQEYLNEDTLESVYKSKKLNYVPPFNLGVVLLNNKIWEKLQTHKKNLLTNAWRLGVWMAENPNPKYESEFGEGPGINELRTNFGSLVTQNDQKSAIPYPSANRWIWDQVSLWITLAEIDSFSYGDFSFEHVLQNGEYAKFIESMPNWILCHYYSQNLERFNSWILEFNAHITAQQSSGKLSAGCNSS